MMDTVNDATLWGLPARYIKLSSIRWQRLLYGVCSYYYKMHYEFDINYESWDRWLWDKGTRYLAPGGTGGNEEHYVQAKDSNDENVKEVFLDGTGHKATSQLNIEKFKVEFYEESNFLLLGVPATIT
jgi:hypothetical protein